MPDTYKSPQGSGIFKMRDQKLYNEEHKRLFQEWAKERKLNILSHIDGCDLQVGQKVTFINEFGVEFPGMEILGFKEQPFYNRFIYISTDSYWFPVAENMLKIE